MTKFISFLFTISDAFAVLLIALALPCITMGLFLLAFGIPPRETPELTRFVVVANCTIWAIAAGGAYMLLRRQVLGLLLVAAFVMKLSFSGGLVLALASAAIFAMVFLLPFILALVQACRSIAKNESAT